MLLTRDVSSSQVRPLLVCHAVWVAGAPKRDLCLHRGSMLVGGHLAGDVVGRRPDLNDVTKVEVGHAAEEVSDRTRRRALIQVRLVHP